MKETKNSKPAPYSKTDEQEILAIDTFKRLVDHKQVKLDVKERDKYPNIDGYIELVDENLVPIGKLEVQIRKLPDSSGTNRKIQCPTSLVAYSEEATCNPVLLIGVNVEQNKAYWVHITKDIIKLKNGNTQKSKVVSFPASNIIDGKNTKYIAEWRNITESYKTKMQGYNEIKESYEKLRVHANPVLGVDKKDFQDIHIFLDEINDLLENKFSIVKKRYYPTAWKIGLAYYEYEDDSVTYTLYPIPFSKNDVQIKEINKTLHEELKREGLGFTGHFTENPFRRRPKEYAIEIVESKTLEILEHRLLDHKGNEFLAKEYIFAFIDHFSRQLGLDIKDSYSISEIEEAFFCYLPIWVDEAIKFMVKVQRNRVRKYADCLYRRPYFDPDTLIVQIMANERKRIGDLVRKRIDQKSPIPRIPLGNRKFPLRIFYEFLSFLKSKGIEKVDRVYLPRDYSRLQKTGGLIYNFFSPAAVEKNLEIFFDNLETAYNDMVLQNFPEIAEKLPLFGNASLIIVVYNVKEKYEAPRDLPTIQFLHLSSRDGGGLKIQIYKKGAPNAPNISCESVCVGESIKLHGKKYRLTSCSKGVLDFIYDDLPMFNFVYDILEENLKTYFEILKKSS